MESLREPPSPWDVAPPVLFNAWKHHAGALHRHLAAAAQGGPPALAALPPRLLVIGTDLMDLYTGPLPPAAIAAGVVAALRAAGRLEPDAFRTWLEENQGYRVVPLAEDGSRWVLRYGAGGDRYVHVHPGRGAPGTRRVRANVLKTAVMVLAFTGAHGGDPCDVPLINRVRREYLGLSPVRDLGSSGLRAVIAELSRGAP
jgi:hypothetical protein